MGSTDSKEAGSATQGLAGSQTVLRSHLQKPQITAVCVSDTHGLDKRPEVLQVPEGDLLIFAGDAGLSSSGDADRFQKWLMSLPHKHKVVTFGNMDFWAKSCSTEELGGAHVLCDRIVNVEGYKIFGSPYTPKFYGVFQFESQQEADAHWRRALPPDAEIDILVTHGPPYGYGDVTKGRHVGDRALLHAVQALKQPPLLWVCGHIHESHGVYQVPHPAGNITLINAANFYVSQGVSEAGPRTVTLPQLQIHQGKLPATTPAESQGEQIPWKAPVSVAL